VIRCKQEAVAILATFSSLAKELKYVVSLQKKVVQALQPPLVAPLKQKAKTTKNK
jgi:hypothetical protein